MGYLYIMGTVMFTVYGQLILKWRIERYGSLPDPFGGKLFFLLKLLFDPFILSGFLRIEIAHSQRTHRHVEPDCGNGGAFT